MCRGRFTWFDLVPESIALRQRLARGRRGADSPTALRQAQGTPSEVEGCERRVANSVQGGCPLEQEKGITCPYLRVEPGCYQQAAPATLRG